MPNPSLSDANRQFLRRHWRPALLFVIVVEVGSAVSLARDVLAYRDSGCIRWTTSRGTEFVKCGDDALQQMGLQVFLCVMLVLASILAAFWVVSYEAAKRP
jgi:hypothetical protein